MEHSRRKRPRRDTDTDNPRDSTSSPDVQTGPISRDETYYRTDGDCVIRVGDVLFKVHRFLLVRDSSVFADMFSMPQENETTSQTVTNENPVVLYDDIYDFRALCWIVYALPMVYMDQTDASKVDISKIVSLYLIAHKYHFESHEQFAQTIIQTHCSNIGGTSLQIREYFTTYSEERLESLLRIACLTEEASQGSSFTSIIKKIWLCRLENNLDTSISSSISYPLGVAEALGLRTFMGQLYYFELGDATGLKKILGSTAYVRPANNLTERQKLALFQGYWSLQQYWSKIMNAPLKQFKCSQSQPSHYCNCNSIWKDFWPKYKTEVVGQPFSPLESLKQIKEKVMILAKERFPGAHPSCIMTYINGMIKELEYSLDDHFLDPLPSSPLSNYVPTVA